MGISEDIETTKMEILKKCLEFVLPQKYLIVRMNQRTWRLEFLFRTTGNLRRTVFNSSLKYTVICDDERVKRYKEKQLLDDTMVIYKLMPDETLKMLLLSEGYFAYDNTEEEVQKELYNSILKNYSSKYQYIK